MLIIDAIMSTTHLSRLYCIILIRLLLYYSLRLYIHLLLLPLLLLLLLLLLLPRPCLLLMMMMIIIYYVLLCSVAHSTLHPRLNNINIQRYVCQQRQQHLPIAHSSSSSLVDYSSPSSSFYIRHFRASDDILR